MPLSLRLVTVCAVALPGLAQADIQVTFRDGAPKDSFVITNTGACDPGPFSVSLDLTPTAGRLIFDITSAGAGVEVFQPFELTSGADYTTALPEVVDGQKTLALAIDQLPVGETVSFTIDVDDTIGAREITVSGSEMAGGTLRVQGAAGASTAIFDSTATAVAVYSACTS